LNLGDDDEEEEEDDQEGEEEKPTGGSPSEQVNWSHSKREIHD
jgi:hypothetical protein